MGIDLVVFVMVGALEIETPGVDGDPAGGVIAAAGVVWVAAGKIGASRSERGVVRAESGCVSHREVEASVGFDVVVLRKGEGGEGPKRSLVLEGGVS